MARYMFIARYTSGGVKGVVTAGGSARRAAIQKMAEAVSYTHLTLPTILRV